MAELGRFEPCLDVALDKGTDLYEPPLLKLAESRYLCFDAS